MKRPARRRSGLAPEPGQRSLDGSKLETPQLGFKVPPKPHTIFLGLGPARKSAETGHYYPGATTQFWKFLHESGMWPDAITAEQDDSILAGGFGLADVSHRPSTGAVQASKAAYFQARAVVKDLVEKYRPQILAFVGKEAYALFTRTPTGDLEHGLQPAFEGVTVFLLPTPSNRNQMMSRKDKLAYYRELAGLVVKHRN